MSAWGFPNIPEGKGNGNGSWQQADEYDEEEILSRALAESASMSTNRYGAGSGLNQQVSSRRQPVRPEPLQTADFPSLPSPVAASSEAVESAEGEELRRALEESARYAAIPAVGTGEDDERVRRAMEESKDILIEQQRDMLERFQAQKAEADRELEREASRVSRQRAQAAGREVGGGQSRKGRRKRRPLEASEVFGFYSERPADDGGGESNHRRGGGRGRGRGRGRGGFLGTGRGLCSAGITGEAERRAGFRGGFTNANTRGFQRPSVTSPGPSSYHRRPVENPLSSTRPAHLQTAVSVSSSEEVLNAIVDGYGVGIEYGQGEWQGRGVELAYTFLQNRGHQVLIFLPQALRDAASSESLDALSRIEAGDADALFYEPVTLKARAKLLMHAVTMSEAEEGKTVLISNYTFRNEIAEQAGSMLQRCLIYLGLFRVPFSWHGDEFVPAPSPSNISAGLQRIPG